MFGFLDDLISGPTGGLVGDLLLGERKHDQAVNADYRRFQMQNELMSRQEEFQKKMRGTAYRTAVKDMQLAGLNPMLAYSQGGAHASGGASGSAPSGGEDHSVGRMSTSAANARHVMEQVRLLKEQQALVIQDARNRRLEADAKEPVAAVARVAGEGAKNLEQLAPRAREALTDVMEDVATKLVPGLRQSAGEVYEGAKKKVTDTAESAAAVIKALPDKVKSMLFQSAEQVKRREELRGAEIPPARRRFDAGEPSERRKPRMRGKLGGAENY